MRSVSAAVGSVGTKVGFGVGEKLGATDGRPVEDTVGWKLGVYEGLVVGTDVVSAISALEGAIDGAWLRP